jgi:hypothetical protein
MSGNKKALIIANRKDGSFSKWVVLGNATVLADGKIMCTFDALPTWDWDGRFMIAPEKPKQATSSSSAPREVEDDYPF